MPRISTKDVHKYKKGTQKKKKTTIKQKKKRTQMLLERTTQNKKGTPLEIAIKGVAESLGFKTISNAYIGFKTDKNRQKYIEIDLIILSKKAVIVVESKNYNCTVRGSLKGLNLNAVYTDSKSYVLYNPLLQNRTHIKYLTEFLNLPSESISSLIVFSDNAVLDFSDKEALKSKEVILNLNNLRDFLSSLMAQDDILTERSLNSKYTKLEKRTKVSDAIKLKHINDIKSLVSQK